MYFFYFVVSFLNLCVGYNFDPLPKFEFLTQCKDNDDVPIDWWYLYKPSDDFYPDDWQAAGLNFTYLTMDSRGKWEPYDAHITPGSMLDYTLMPMYKPSMKNKVAYAIYEENSVSSAQGILMAGERGGVWITHSVPSFPDITRRLPKFPDSEKEHGHLVMCFSLNLVTINEIAFLIKVASPKFVSVHIPSSMDRMVPNWAEWVGPTGLTPNRPVIDFEVSDVEPVKVMAMARQPGDNYCLYRSFAKQRSIVLDVYGQTENKYLSSACGDKYSVRNIESISLKFPDYIYYVRKQRDLSRFAVSTAAQWQKQGSGLTQYWVCTSNLDKEDNKAKGGILVCVEDYNIWLAFRNLVVKEPECY